MRWSTLWKAVSSLIVLELRRMLCTLWSTLWSTLWKAACTVLPRAPGTPCSMPSMPFMPWKTGCTAEGVYDNHAIEDLQESLYKTIPSLPLHGNHRRAAIIWNRSLRRFKV